MPEIVLKQGQFVDTWRDARLFAVAAGSAWYFWRRTLLGTIVSALVYLGVAGQDLGIAGEQIIYGLYDSFVLLAVPLGVLGAVLGATMRELPNDVFFKVGLITVIGLTAKNEILIIELAKDMHAQGMGLIEATLQACHLRFRPIVMTGLAFVCGVAPMVIASGAGAKSQHAIGTGVMGGMIAATVLGVFFVPLLYVVVAGTVRRWRKAPAAEPAEAKLEAQ